MRPDCDSSLLLSIVTVCKDDSARLESTIRSLNYFYDDPRFEHILIDGMSKDGINEIIRCAWNKKNFRFYAESDSGIYDAMNRGSLYSRAPFILYLNCGDKIGVSPDKLADWLWRIIEVAGTNGLDIACFPVKYIESRGIYYCKPSVVSLHKMPVSHQGMIFSSSFVKENKYVPKFKIAGDFDLYLRAGNVSVIDDMSLQALTYVQKEGLASNNPIRSYREYLYIAATRLNGCARIKSMIRILTRALIVIPCKTILPNFIIARIRIK